MAVCAYIRKRSPFFWLKYGPHSSPSYESSKIRVDDPDADYKLAKKINKIESRLLIRHAGSGWDWVPKFFELHYRNSAATLRIHRNAWNWIAAWLRERSIKSPDALTSRADVLEYAEWRMSQVKQKSGRSPARNTALYEMRVLGRVMNEAVLRDMAEKNPAANLGLKRDSPKPKPEILPDEQATILDALRGKPDWMREPFRIALQSGLRWHETRINLRRDVDWQRQRITVPDPKGGVTRAFTFEVMQLSLLDHLQAHARGHRQFPYALPSRLPKPIGMIWREFFDALGYDEISFHCTRVTFITWCHRSRIPEQIVMRLVNHASEEIHRIYRRLDADDVRVWRDPRTMAAVIPQLQPSTGAASRPGNRAS